MTTDIVLYILLALLGIILSALFSGSETGLYTINRVRLVVRANRGERAAQRVRAQLNNQGRMLATILIGNNIANYFGGYGIGGVLNAMGFSDGQAIVINAVLLIPLLFVFGEILPKDLFRTNTDQWTYRIAGFLQFWTVLLWYCGLTPIVQWFGRSASRFFGGDASAPTTARQRMSQLIYEGVSAGVLTETQTTFVDRALAMRHQTVDEVLIPWSRVVSIPLNATSAQRTSILRARNFSRFPVIDPRGRVVGKLPLLAALLEPDTPVEELMEPIGRFEIGAPLRETLHAMRRARETMAIIHDPRRPNAPPRGIVTLKDLVEPLTGELAAW